MLSCCENHIHPQLTTSDIHPHLLQGFPLSAAATISTINMNTAVCCLYVELLLILIEQQQLTATSYGPVNKKSLYIDNHTCRLVRDGARRYK